MSVDRATVAKIASLARIRLDEDALDRMVPELNTILSFVEQLGQVDVTGVEPMTSVTPMATRMRPDVVTDGMIADRVLANAPASEDHYFVVPKVIE